MKNTPVVNLVTLIFVTFGVLFSGLAYFFYKKQTDFKETAIKTKGRVITLQVSRKGTKAPIIEYQDKNQQTHLYYHDVYTKPSMYSVDEEVEIMYSPNNFEDARIDGDYTIIYIFGFLGIVFIIVSLGVWFAFRMTVTL